MAFKLHPEAREWFKKINNQGPFGTLFDIYQCCLTLGLSTGRWEPDTDTVDGFMDEFIARYRPYQSLIIGSVVATVLIRKGIISTDREAIAKEIARIVSGDSVRGELTVEGFREINGYAMGGFNHLRENFDDRPQQSVYFLSYYRQLLLKAATEGVKI
jgi:hypothetical protein